MLKSEITTASPERNWVIPFAATLFGMLTLQMSNLGFSPLMPEIQKDFGLSYSQVGLFTGLAGLVAIFFSIPAGMLAKRFGEKAMLSAGLLIVAAGLLLLSQAPNSMLCFGGRVIWQMGYRTAFVCVMTAVALTSPATLKSSAMGIVGAMGAAASMVGAPFGSSIESVFGWRNGIMAYAGMALLGAVVFFAFYRRNPRTIASAASETQGFAPTAAAPNERRSLSAYRNPHVWALALVMAIAPAAGISVTFFVPSVLKSVYKMESLDAAYVISIGYFAAIFANLLFGRLSDRFNKFAILCIVLVLLAGSTLSMTLGDLFLFRAATALVIALGLSSANLLYAAAGEMQKGREVGPVMGVVGLGAGVGVYFGPQMLGLLTDWTNGFDAGWYFLAGITVLGLALVIFLKYHSELPRNRNASRSTDLHCEKT